MFKKEIIAAVTLAATHAIKIGENWSNVALNHSGNESLDHAVTVSLATDTDPGTGLAQIQDDIVPGGLEGIVT